MSATLLAALVLGAGAAAAIVSATIRHQQRPPATDYLPDPVEDADVITDPRDGVQYGPHERSEEHAPEQVIYEGERVFSPMFHTAGWPFKAPAYQKSDGTWWQPTREQTWESSSGSRARTWGRPIPDPRSS